MKRFAIIAALLGGLALAVPAAASAQVAYYSYYGAAPSYSYYGGYPTYGYSYYSPSYVYTGPMAFPSPYVVNGQRGFAYSYGAMYRPYYYSYWW